jgi:hypothetical protein
MLSVEEFKWQPLLNHTNPFLAFAGCLELGRELIGSARLKVFLAPLDLQIPKRSKDTREVRRHDTIHRMAARYSLLLAQWDGSHETSAVRTRIRSLALSQLTPCDFERHVAP